MSKKNQRFFIQIPVKPYVKKFIEINYGDSPVDFAYYPEEHKLLTDLFHKPSHDNDAKISDYFDLYSEILEVSISEHDFYHYGWELSKTNTIIFGRHFERRAKLFMRVLVGASSGYCFPLNESINDFQETFGFDTDDWSYESIKKDFFRNGHKYKTDYKAIINHNIQRICLQNLSDLGTITPRLIKYYETAIKNK